MFGRLWQRLKLLWKLAKSERAASREIGWAVALGVFAGCTPAVGFHGGLALALATIFRKNRLFCWIGSRVSNVLTLPFVAYAQVQVAHWLRTGAFLDVDRRQILEHWTDVVLDWILGTIPVGGGLSLLLGLAAYGWAKRRRRRQAREDAAAVARISAPPAEDATDAATAATPPPAEPRTPSSESLVSG